MKIIATSLVSGLLALGLSAGAALAQGATTTAPSSTPAVKPPVTATIPPVGTPPVAAKAKGIPKAASTPEGIECSSQADAKNLHGKERVKFRKKCIADIKKAAGGAKAAAKPASTAPVTTAPATTTLPGAKKN